MRSRRLLVTGATSGLGFDVCRALENSSFEIVGIGRNVTEAARKLPFVEYRILDLADPKRVQEEIIERGKAERYDAMVLCAGQTGAYCDAVRQSWADFEYIMKINFFDNLQIIGSLDQILNQYGSVVVVSSNTLSFKSSTFNVPYACSKANLEYISFMYEKKLHSSPNYFRINVVRPGLIDTGLRHRTPGYKEEDYTRRVNMTPLGRAGHPHEVSGLIRFLLSEESTYITGQLISVSGGE